MWEGCTQIPCNYVVPAGIRLVYCLEMGFYLQVGLAEWCCMECIWCDESLGSRALPADAAGRPSGWLMQCQRQMGC
jgi:hypothetical protein